MCWLLLLVPERPLLLQFGVGEDIAFWLRGRGRGGSLLASHPPPSPMVWQLHLPILVCRRQRFPTREGRLESELKNKNKQNFGQACCSTVSSFLHFYGRMNILQENWLPEVSTCDVVMALPVVPRARWARCPGRGSRAQVAAAATPAFLLLDMHP